MVSSEQSLGISPTALMPLTRQVLVLHQSAISALDVFIGFTLNFVSQTPTKVERGSRK